MSGSVVDVWLDDQRAQQIFPMGIIDDAAALLAGFGPDCDRLPRNSIVWREYLTNLSR